MVGRRYDVARLQSDFYRDQFRRLLRWLIVSIFIILAQILGIIYLILSEPKRQYYANTTEGKILYMPRPITVPNE